MATLPKKIADAFIKQLADFPEFDAEKLARLERVLEGKTKPKVAELVSILSMPRGGDLK